MTTDEVIRELERALELGDKRAFRRIVAGLVNENARLGAENSVLRAGQQALTAHRDRLFEEAQDYGRKLEAMADWDEWSSASDEARRAYGLGVLQGYANADKERR